MSIVTPQWTSLSDVEATIKETSSARLIMICMGLSEISKHYLSATGYTSISQYVRKEGARLGLTIPSESARRYVQAASVIHNLHKLCSSGEIPYPTSLKQLRMIARVAKHKRSEYWEKVHHARANHQYTHLEPISVV